MTREQKAFLEEPHPEIKVIDKKVVETEPRYALADELMDKRPRWWEWDMYLGGI